MAGRGRGCREAGVLICQYCKWRRQPYWRVDTLASRRHHLTADESIATAQPHNRCPTILSQPSYVTAAANLATPPLTHLVVPDLHDPLTHSLFHLFSASPPISLWASPDQPTRPPAHNSIALPGKILAAQSVVYAQSVSTDVNGDSAEYAVPWLVKAFPDTVWSSHECIQTCKRPGYVIYTRTSGYYLFLSFPFSINQSPLPPTPPFLSFLMSVGWN